MQFQHTHRNNSKIKTPTRILAIDPGTRTMGLAVLEDQSLIYVRVKTFERTKRRRELLRQVEEYVSSLIDDYDPSMLVIEKSFAVCERSRFLLAAVIKILSALGKRRRLDVAFYAPSTVRKRVAGSGRASKRDLAKAVVRRYPHLYILFDRPRKLEEKFWSNLFDAVALGLAHHGD